MLWSSLTKAQARLHLWLVLSPGIRYGTSSVERPSCLIAYMQTDNGAKDALRSCLLGGSVLLAVSAGQIQRPSGMGLLVLSDSKAETSLLVTVVE